MYHVTSKYLDDEVTVKLLQYHDKTTAVELITADYDRVKVSVNLSAYYKMPQTPRHFFVKGYGEMEGMANALQRAGIATVENYVEEGGFDSCYYEMRLADNVN